MVCSISTSTKENAQLQNTLHNCKTNCTTAKKNAQWQFSFALTAGDCDLREMLVIFDAIFNVHLSFFCPDNLDCALGCNFFSLNKYAEEQSRTGVLGWHLLRVFFCLHGFVALLHLQMRKCANIFSRLFFVSPQSA